VIAPPSDMAFQQTPEASPQFLQNVAKPDRATTRKPEHKLTRVTFRVSRLMEFCSKRELQNQTGHSVYDWPLVVLKEIMDNALDACEEAEVAPVIEVTVGPGSITIQDNADGLDADTIESILDYTIRVSSREAYVSPTRGAQGNALKTILAMGYVLDREAADRDADAAGVTIIETRGVKHRIEFGVDHINNQPKIEHTKTPSAIDVGTKVTVGWPKSQAEELFLFVAEQFQQLTQAYFWFNPHLSLRGVWYGREFVNVEATDPNWEKWRPRNPTSPHYIVEFAFGLHQSGLTQQGAAISRKIITGANWSVGIHNPFRAFGSTGEGLESTLAKVRANAREPVICALHLASAYIQYADRGKSSIILTDDAKQPDD